MLALRIIPCFGCKNKLPLGHKDCRVCGHKAPFVNKPINFAIIAVTAILGIMVLFK